DSTSLADQPGHAVLLPALRPWRRASPATGPSVELRRNWQLTSSRYTAFVYGDEHGPRRCAPLDGDPTRDRGYHHCGARAPTAGETRRPRHRAHDPTRPRPGGAQLEDIELGEGLVTTPRQTMYDLLMRPNQGKLPDAARDAARNFRGQVSGDDLAEICEWYGRANDAVKKCSATSGMDSFVPEPSIPRAVALGGGFDGGQVALCEHAT